MVLIPLDSTTSPLGTCRGILVHMQEVHTKKFIVLFLFTTAKYCKNKFKCSVIGAWIILGRLLSVIMEINELLLYALT